MKSVNKKEFLKISQANKDKLIVLLFAEDWCDFSAKVENHLKEASDFFHYNQVIFLKISPDIGKLWNDLNFYDIIVVPTVIILKNNKLLHKVTVGIKTNKIIEMIEGSLLLK